VNTKMTFGDLTSMASIQERAKGIRVKLVEKSGRWQLVSE
jgi:hypothetical protein